jgi:two-component system phosphate regulon response regulator OmpR
MAVTADEIASENHILVVDDDDRLGTLLSRYLGDHGYRVTVAKDAADARAHLRGLDFDLLIVDVMMPGESGLDFARNLRQSSEVPILILTAMGEPQDRIAGLSSGADDYLPKPFEPEELLLRIASILRRAQRAGLRPKVIRLGALSFDPGTGELSREGRPIALTSGEMQLLSIFARTPGVPISRAELARRGGAEGRAVDVQITRLRRKIEPDPKVPRYLQTVWGEGYVLRIDRT